MFCQNCGAQISNESTNFCPKCGSPVSFGSSGTADDATVSVVGNANVDVPVRPKFRHDISAIWPEWEIEKQLGRGSYGVVYQVVRKDSDNDLETHAAVKIISIPADAAEADSLRSEGIGEEGSRTYFKRIVDGFVSEIRLMDSMKGTQNIVSVEDYKVVEKTDTIGWDIYIRMELLTPFGSYLQNRNITEDEVIKLGCDICSALEICAGQNIIHRDIKPENIFINKFGHFKLGDFGIARKLENSTGGLSQKGTFNYMAPEVATGTHYGVGADIYSLGIVLYRLLNGNRLPFLENEQQVLNPEERKRAVERRIRGEVLPKPSDASPAMADIILRACDFDPGKRFASAMEFKQALMDAKYGKYVVAEKQPEPDYDKTVSAVNRDAFINVQPQKTESVNNNVVNKPAPEKAAPQNNVPRNTPVEKKASSAKPEASPEKKKKLKLIGIIAAAVVVVIILIAALSDSGGSSVSKSDNSNNSSKTSSVAASSSVENGIVGKYMIYSMTDGSITVDKEGLKQVGQDDSYIEFKANKTFILYFSGESPVVGTYDETTKTLTSSGETLKYSKIGNRITITMDDTIITFSK